MLRPIIKLHECAYPVIALAASHFVFNLFNAHDQCMTMACALSFMLFNLNNKNKINTLLTILICTPFLYMAAYLFGAPLLVYLMILFNLSSNSIFVRDWNRTLLWAVWTASYGVVPLARIMSITPSTIFQLVSGKRQLQDENAILFAWSVMIMNWMASVVIPLDWNRSWQKWPVPNSIIGGACSGLAYHAALKWINYCRSIDDKTHEKDK